MAFFDATSTTRKKIDIIAGDQNVIHNVKNDQHPNQVSVCEKRQTPICGIRLEAAIATTKAYGGMFLIGQNDQENVVESLEAVKGKSLNCPAKVHHHEQRKFSVQINFFDAATQRVHRAAHHRESKVREKHVEFCAGPSSIDHICTLRQVLEWLHYFGQPKMAVLLDFRFIFDCPCSQKLRQCLTIMGISSKPSYGMKIASTENFVLGSAYQSSASSLLRFIIDLLHESSLLAHDTSLMASGPYDELCNITLFFFVAPRSPFIFDGTFQVSQSSCFLLMEWQLGRVLRLNDDDDDDLASEGIACTIVLVSWCVVDFLASIGAIQLTNTPVVCNVRRNYWRHRRTKKCDSKVPVPHSGASKSVSVDFPAYRKRVWGSDGDIYFSSLGLFPAKSGELSGVIVICDSMRFGIHAYFNQSDYLPDRVAKHSIPWSTCRTCLASGRKSKDPHFPDWAYLYTDPRKDLLRLVPSTKWDRDNSRSITLAVNHGLASNVTNSRFSDKIALDELSAMALNVSRLPRRLGGVAPMPYPTRYF
ncbi:hypothetical protein CLF_108362 [Clonorchis sinensis]|uniref:Uncharacterized protein n=1 Tax=Clonorchis sinensis TaxID=79923 RepID=G7YHY1_CLOSI|nr:hypothetical protein CLF_108362 [Clonorchis sinensis]